MTPSEEPKGKASFKNKPDLRKAAADTRPAKIIAAACLLVACYMYPMIFKPLFGIGSEFDRSENEIEEIKAGLEKRRPKYMPEWSSPFGPKSRD